ncbi:MAG: 3-deoxy-D-manno-octulosonic acid transferase [Candidatus Omnitrophica bacterium]|nr:3-deoxy-D-manno-octulosonic acid transferase [Candidatus Omnitrophota bacterium]
MLYDIGFLIFSIIYLPTLLFKGKLHGNFLERFGIYEKCKRDSLSSGEERIWIQAVSVGEVSLCRALIPLLKGKFPDKEIVLSTITRTGNDLAKKIFSGEAVVIYFPLDFSFIVKKVVSLIRPGLYIMVETEIWPNMIKETSDNKIPSILINGRISDKSFGMYRLAKLFLKDILTKIDKFCMQSEIDAERIISLGAPSGRVGVTGSMKFDIEAAGDAESAQKMRESLGLKADAQLLVAGSTHNGEEDIVIEVFKNLLREFPGLNLLIAPRHVERVAEVERAARQFGFESARVSSLQLKAYSLKRPFVFILDTIGQLKDVYAIATLVFMGGSLVKHGGQNPIEPAVSEKAILFGPYMFNFKDIASIFLKNGAAIQVMNKKDLLEKAKSLLKDSAARIQLGQNAKRTVSENRGATERNLDAAVHLFVDDR